MLIHEQSRPGRRATAQAPLTLADTADLPEGLRRNALTVAALAGREAASGVPSPMKLPDWGLSEAVVAWCDGCDFDKSRGCNHLV